MTNKKVPVSFFWRWRVKRRTSRKMIRAPLALLLVGLLAHAYQEVTDPYKFVAAEEDLTEQGLTRFFLDINRDGIDELFIASTELIGKGGGKFFIFQESPKGYQALGSIFAYPGSVQVIGLTNHGYSNLQTCTTVSADQCNLIEYVFNGRAYAIASQKAVDFTSIEKLYKPEKRTVEHSGPTQQWAPKAAIVKDPFSINAKELVVDAKTKMQFVDSVKASISKNDQAAFMNLHYLKNVSDEIIASRKRSFERITKHKTLSVEIAPVTPDDKIDQLSDGQHFLPSLKSIYKLVIKIKFEGNEDPIVNVLPMGVFRNKLYLTLPTMSLAKRSPKTN